MIQETMDQKLKMNFSPLFLSIENESPKHGLPAEAEKHFKVILVSEKFQGLSRIDRQRQVNLILADELANHVHALSMQVFTPEEWQKKDGQTFSTPNCRGGRLTD